MCIIAGLTAIGSTVSGLATGLGTSAASLIGGVGGAANSIVGGVTQNRVARFNAQVQQNNAQIARDRAQQVQGTAALDIVRRQRERHQASGRYSALVGASGIEHSGSPLDVLVRDAEQGALDTAIIRANAEQQARDLYFDAANSEFEANRIRGRGQRAFSNSLLSGAQQIAGIFL